MRLKSSFILVFLPLCARLPIFAVAGNMRRLIISGTPVTDAHEYSFIVPIQLCTDGGSPQFLCTGSLLNNKVVLTAAHCLDSVTDRTQLQIVSDTLSGEMPSADNIWQKLWKKTPSKTHMIARHVIHPGYIKGASKLNGSVDAAILVLADPVSDLTPMGKQRIYPKLPRNRESAGMCDSVITAGYGNSYAAQPSLLRPDRVLRVKSGTVIASSTFRTILDDVSSYRRILESGKTFKESFVRSHSGLFSSHQVSSAGDPYFSVTRDPVTGGTASLGDSGGPVFVEREPGKIELRGVQSGSMELLLDRVVDISRIKDFIELEMEKLQSLPPPKGSPHCARCSASESTWRSLPHFFDKISGSGLEKVHLLRWRGAVKAMSKVGAGAKEIGLYEKACKEYLNYVAHVPNQGNNSQRQFVIMNCESHAKEKALSEMRDIAGSLSFRQRYPELEKCLPGSFFSGFASLALPEGTSLNHKLPSITKLPIPPFGRVNVPSIETGEGESFLKVVGLAGIALLSSLVSWLSF